MLNYLLKNFGLTALGFCILLTSITLSESILKLQKTLQNNTTTISDMNVCKQQLSSLALRIKR